MVRHILRGCRSGFHNLLFHIMQALSAQTDFEAGCVICVDKPLEWTSTDVVRKIKFSIEKLGYRKIKVGHAGTLDPLATGVLIICVGKATKRVEELQAERKEYVAEMILGATTPSYDMEHEVDKHYQWEHISEEQVKQVLTELCGERLQTPPLYSAKKLDGKRAYEYAREGETVALRQALINIYGMELLEFEPPRIKVRVECSKGTYIRSLAKEIGEGLNSGAYLKSLRRTKSGDFDISRAMKMDEIIKILTPMKQN